LLEEEVFALQSALLRVWLRPIGSMSGNAG